MATPVGCFCIYVEYFNQNKECEKHFKLPYIATAIVYWSYFDGVAYSKWLTNGSIVSFFFPPEYVFM